MFTDRIHEGLRDRHQALGTWVQMNSPESCEIAGLAGFDFVIIDMEHGAFGLAETSTMVKTAQLGGADPIVRVPEGTDINIRQVLDLGARGVLIPGIRTAADAAAAVAAARYEPRGTRGACPCVRSVGYGITPWVDCLHEQPEPHVWLLIETPEAVQNITEIVSSGADAIVLGPFDLSMAMGLNGDFHHPDVEAALETALGAAQAAGLEIVYVGLDQTPADNAAGVAAWQKRGSRIATTLLDRTILVHAYQSTLALVRTPTPVSASA